MSVDNFKIKRDLEKREAELRQELSNLPDLGIIKTAAASKRAEYNKYTGQDKTRAQAEPWELKILKKEAEGAEKKVADVEKQRHELTNELDGVIEHLASLSFKISKKNLLTLQENKCSIEKTIQRLRSTIKQVEEGGLAAPVGNDHPLAVLNAQKESLLADAAMGQQINEAELQAIEEQILEEEKQHSELVDGLIKKAQTVEGLKTKLAEQTEALQVAKEQHRDAFSIFIRQEIETAGQEYVTHAENLISVLLKILSMSDILKNLGLPHAVTGGRLWKMEIPKLNVAACNPTQQPTCLFSFDHIGDKRQQASQDTKRGLEIMGINIPQ